MDSLGVANFFPSAETVPGPHPAKSESHYSTSCHPGLDAVVLDLFSGTGALGIESASRGAAAVVCIDDSPAAVRAIQKNVSAFSIESIVKVIKWDISRDLGCIRSPQPLYDLIFMDPPYGGGLVEKALKNLHKSQSVKQGATLVVEHSKREPLPNDLPFLSLTDQRKYGKTLVSFLVYMV